MVILVLSSFYRLVKMFIKHRLRPNPSVGHFWISSFHCGMTEWLTRTGRDSTAFIECWLNTLISNYVTITTFWDRYWICLRHHLVAEQNQPKEAQVKGGFRRLQRNITGLAVQHPVDRIFSLELLALSSLPPGPHAQHPLWFTKQQVRSPNWYDLPA